MVHCVIRKHEFRTLRSKHEKCTFVGLDLEARLVETYFLLLLAVSEAMTYAS